MKRTIILFYGVVSYAIFFVTFLYAMGFVGNLVVPKSIDSEPQVPFMQALLINTVLLGIFALQHSVMARPAFKRWLTKFVPTPAERSTYVLFSSLALIVLFWQWQPMGIVIWDVENPVARMMIHGIFLSGWLLVLLTTFWINHFDLFGLRQVYLYWQSKPYTQLKFVTPWLYKYIRHPLYLGWFLAFWATPTMTAAHLLFAVMTTAYILIAIQLEERDLIAVHGMSYVEYRKKTPMIIPKLFGKKAKDKELKPATNTGN